MGTAIRRLWMRFWMRLAGHNMAGRLAMRIASWSAPPYRGQTVLARLSAAGFHSPSITRHHPDVRFGEHTFVGDRVVLFSRDGTGRIRLADRVYVYQETFLETGEGGEIHIGADSSVHPRCQLMAYKASIRIGQGVSIAQGCAFYPFDHGIEPGRTIRSQPLVVKGDIEIGDEAWLGTGVVVLSGVRIGAGAVVSAGSVVTRDVPDNAVAAGVPARVVWRRGGVLPTPSQRATSQAAFR